MPAVCLPSTEAAAVHNLLVARGMTCPWCGGKKPVADRAAKAAAAATGEARSTGQKGEK